MKNLGAIIVSVGAKLVTDLPLDGEWRLVACLDAFGLRHFLR